MVSALRRTIEVELPAYCAQWPVAVAHGTDEVFQWFERDCR